VSDLLTSKRPYLLRAVHEWLTDNNETPLIVVDAEHPDVIAPGGYADKGKLVLNISYAATSALHIGNETITFSARFNGRPMNLHIPVDAVMAAYGRESGEGMVFAIADDDLSSVPDSAGKSGSKPATPAKPSPPKLTIIK
jgi:stringent starvation protein B